MTGGENRYSHDSIHSDEGSLNPPLVLDLDPFPVDLEEVPLERRPFDVDSNGAFRHCLENVFLSLIHI